MTTKAFASSADRGEKTETLEVLGDGVYALTAQGDPNVGAIEGKDFLVAFEARATPVAARDWLTQLRQDTVGEGCSPERVQHCVAADRGSSRVRTLRGARVRTSPGGESRSRTYTETSADHNDQLMEPTRSEALQPAEAGRRAVTL